MRSTEMLVDAVLRPYPINATLAQVRRAAPQLTDLELAYAVGQAIEGGYLRAHERDASLSSSHFSVTPAGDAWLEESAPYRELDALLERARAAFEALTPDQQLHHRHLQSISFATGNVAIGHPPEEHASIAAAVLRAAGACPCGACTASALVPEFDMDGRAA